MRISYIIFLLIFYIYQTGSLHSATFETLKEWRSGAWTAALYNNVNGNRKFCALESVSDDGSVIFRINMYENNKDAFLEIFSEEWNKIEGNFPFILRYEFDNGMDGKYIGYRAEVKFDGQSDKNSYYYDFSEREKFYSTLGFIMYATKIEVLDSNENIIASYAMSGSNRAVEKFKMCLNDYAF